MFYFPEETYIGKDFDLMELFEFLKISNKDHNVRRISLSNTLNRNTLKLNTLSEQEMYVIRINTNGYGIPIEVLEKLIKNIKIPTVYILRNKCFEKYILPVKSSDNKKLLRILHTGWIIGDHPFNKIEIGMFDSIDQIFRFFIEKISMQNFDDDESYEDFINRIVKIDSRSKPHSIFDWRKGCNEGCASMKSMKDTFSVYKDMTGTKWEKVKKDYLPDYLRDQLETKVKKYTKSSDLSWYQIDLRYRITGNQYSIYEFELINKIYKPKIIERRKQDAEKLRQKRDEREGVTRSVASVDMLKPNKDSYLEFFLKNQNKK